jgi:hypothetical protein
MKTSKKGYLRNSPDVNKPQNIIEGGDITMKGVDFNVHGVDSNGYAKVMTPGNNYKFPNAEYVIETPIKNKRMNKDLKYMPIDDKAGTFMSKHCSSVSYGAPLENKSCGSPNKKIDPKLANKMADAVSLEARAKKRGISGTRQRQLDSENYSSTLEELYRGEGPKKILGHKPEPQKFGGRDWEFETIVIGGDEQRVPKYKLKK